MKHFLAALMGFFFICVAYAETIPATQNTTGKTTYYRVTGMGAAIYDGSKATTAEASCQLVPSLNSNFSYMYVQMNGDGSSGYCYLKQANTFTTYWVVERFFACPAGSSEVSGQCVTWSCPAGGGYTLDSVNHTCSRIDCQPGQTLVNGVCTCDNGAQTGTDGQCCPVAGSGGGAPMQWCYVDGPAASNCETTAANKCKIRCTNVTFQQGTGAQLTIYPKLALGQSCKYTGTVNATSLGGGPLNNDELNEVSEATADPGRADTPEGCLASGQGYVTGSTGTHCVSGGDTGVTSNETSTESNSDGSSDTTNENSTQGENGTGSETTTETHTNPDGSTTTTTTTTTCHQDGTCTTTTTTEDKDANGNTTSDTSKTKDEPKSKFCDEKPESAMCKDYDETCKQNPDRASCRDLGQPPDEGLLESSEVGPSSISAVSVGGAGQCPQGPALPLGLGNFSFDGICQLATGIRPVILALAWLAAGLIVIGAFRES